MKRTMGLVFVTMMMGAAALGPIACSDDGSLDPVSPGTSSSSSSSSGTSGNPDGSVGGTEEITGDISGARSLSNAKQYLLKGLVRVKEGATLTIEKGTTIMGDNATKAVLLVEPGGKLIAEGTAEEPIVFTSQAVEGQKRAGQWGGIIILGKARVNWPGGKGNVEGFLKTDNSTQYGGTDDDDSSGVIKYVRIEYSGVLVATDNEVNGLTFAGVGRGTVVDYVQVRYTLDDCFEFFGGTVNAKHLVCTRNQDDGFDFDNGYQGKLQFLVLQQDPTHAGDDNGFESDNDSKGTVAEPFTSPTVYNATLCGQNTNADKQQVGLLNRVNARGKYNNLVITGFEQGFDLRDKQTKEAALAGALDIRSSLFFNSKGTGVIDNIAYAEPKENGTAPDKDNDDMFDDVGFIKEASRNNTWDKDPQVNCFDATAPVFGPAATIPGEAPPADGFFDATANYKGAFKDASDKWATTGKWVVWSAQ